ncbi:MAG: hypothetical protein OEV06_08655 [Anaerolineae bacterium]|nr:hypothetical protein [Anaerolineae bacterium]
MKILDKTDIRFLHFKPEKWTNAQQFISPDFQPEINVYTFGGKHAGSNTSHTKGKTAIRSLDSHHLCGSGKRDVSNRAHAVCLKQ